MINFKVKAALSMLGDAVQKKDKQKILQAYDYAKQIDWDQELDTDFKKWDALVSKANDILLA